MSPVRRGVLALLVSILGALPAACDSPSTGVANIGVPESDAGTRETVPNLSCSGLDECTCAQTPGCAPLATDCYCPPDSCGSAAACACQGGRYLGCNPVGVGCSTSSCGLLAQPSAPDQNGCTACVEPADCQTAITELAGSCAALPTESTQWLCGTEAESCAAFCLAGLRTCDSAVCALCLGCSCSNDLFDSCLNECLSSAQNRH